MPGGLMNKMILSIQAGYKGGKKAKSYDSSLINYYNNQPVSSYSWQSNNIHLNSQY